MTVGPLFNVVIVGAGEINFGSPEGLWNHSARLEAILGARLRVLSIVDPDEARSQQRIAERQASSSIPLAWSATQAHRDVQAAGQAWRATEVHLVVLGCPPHFRGTPEAGRDMDLQTINALPHAKGLLIEKPVAALDPARADCAAVAARLAAWAAQGRVVSVGYMLRYLSAVQRIKDILEANKLVPTCINARYYMAYAYACKAAWWDKSISCGPVVEQATHFVDLIRYIAGEGNEVRADSIQATSVEHHESAGRLSKLGLDESAIEPEKRVPRVTTAFWKHAKGTIGTLCHAISLHVHPYDTELEVLADGWVIKLRGSYSTKPTLSVLGPDSDKEEVFSVEDDPFYSEMDAVIKAVTEGHPSPGILSSFEDALQTYWLTWHIRHASESGV